MRHRVLFVTSASILTVLMAISLAHANDLPIKTNPNLIHFGYYHTDTTIHGGPYFNEIFPYTSLFIAVGDNVCSFGPDAWSANYQNNLQAAFDAGKDIYAMPGDMWCLNPGDPYYDPRRPVMTRAQMIDLLAPYWSRVKYIEVLHEPTGMSADQVNAVVAGMHHDITVVARLAPKPYGIMQSACAASNGPGCVADHAAKTASSLNYVGVEVYVDVNQSAADQAALINAAKLATPLSKNIVLVGMGFDRNQSNVDPRKLTRLQKAVYLGAYNDSRVTAVTIFVYGRQLGDKGFGGTRLHPELKIAHYQMAERIIGWTPPPFPVNHSQYLAEGAQGGMFNTAIAIANPNSEYSHARVLFRRTDGLVRSQYTLLPPFSRTTIYPEDIGGFASAEFGTVVESDQKLAVERIMRWAASGYGMHLESSVDASSTTWYLAEGSTGGSFNTYYLLLNPTAAEVLATVTYLRPAPAPPVVKTYTLLANSRVTIDVNAVSELGPSEVSASITATGRIVVERAMYFTGSGPLFRAGMSAVGVRETSAEWYFAEGSTGFFNMYLLIANPTATATTVQGTYYVQGGAPMVINHAVPANSRITIDVNAQPGLASVPLSVRLVTLNGVRVVAERTMLWGAGWYEGHTAAGAAQRGTGWAIAGLEVGLTYDSAAFVLIANPTASAGTADVMLLFGDNNCLGFTPNCTPVRRTISLAPQSRTTLDIRAEFPEAFRHIDDNGVSHFVGKLVGVRVQSSVPVVVEHAQYSSAVPNDGQHWTAGGAALATRLF